MNLYHLNQDKFQNLRKVFDSVYVQLKITGRIKPGINKYKSFPSKSDRIGTAPAWYLSGREISELKKSGLNIDYHEEIEFFKQSLNENRPHPLRALRVHQMARMAHSINNRGRILRLIAQKYPKLESIMFLSQMWIYHAPRLKTFSLLFF